MVGEIIDKYVLTSVPELGDDMLSSTYNSPVCRKTHNRVTTLIKHCQEKHGQKPSRLPSRLGDGKFAYVTNDLSLCVLLRNFVNARKLGDGGRLFRSHKLMLLLFRQDGRTKYAYQVFLQIAQVKCLLSPRMAFQLTWNRFANNRGQKDSNVELECELEHRNKYFK